MALGGTPAAVTTYPQVGTANDGKIVAAGYTTVVTGHRRFNIDDYESVVTRYNLDGTPDTSFGNGGQVLDTISIARAVAVQKDGKVLVAGAVMAGDGTIPLPSPGANSLALARLNPDGSLDTSFGNGGVVTVSFAAGSDTFGETVAAQPDGKIIVAGGNTAYSSKNKTSNGANSIVLVRFSTDGSLDTNFGTGGKVLATVPTYVGGASLGVDPMGMALDPVTGRIAVEGPDPNSKEMVTCFKSDGTLDTTFGGTGFESMPALSSRPGIAIEPSSHQIVIAGQGTGRETLVRLNADGSPDVSFGAGGTAATNLVDFGVTQTLILQPDGHILLGMAGDGGGAGGVMEVARFDPAGNLDTSFGENGLAHTPYGPGFQSTVEFAGMAVEPDGRIVILGDGLVNQPYIEFDLARFLATGPQIGSFSADSGTVPPGSRLTLTASGITDANPNSTVTQVAFYVQANGMTTLLGYGSPSGGVWTFTFTVNLAPGTYTLIAQATDSYGVVGDPSALDLQVV
jgi:uncharacterized delta-60 repeat protein